MTEQRLERAKGRLLLLSQRVIDLMGGSFAGIKVENKWPERLEEYDPYCEFWARGCPTPVVVTYVVGGLFTHQKAREHGESYELLVAIHGQAHRLPPHIAKEVRKWFERTRPVKVDEGYLVGVTVHDPGVRYHKDGSGTPPDQDFHEYGAFPFSGIDACATLVLSKLAEHVALDRIEELADVGLSEEDQP